VPITCYLDAFSGISGDMLVGALADAGADQDAIARAIASMNAGASVSFEKVKRCGIAATKFHVHDEHDHAHAHDHEHGGHSGHDHEHDHEHGEHAGHSHEHEHKHSHAEHAGHSHPHEHGHAHEHRDLARIVTMIEKADLPALAKANAIAVFRRLGEAEAEAHRVPIEKVHFHEVGAVDSIADIVGACTAFALLGVEAVVCSPVNVGSGTVKTEHGILPVPAPATARLLAGAPIYSRGPAMELTTPTGAAIAATLSSGFGVMPPMKVSRIGYGAGTREFEQQPNVLRVMVGEPTGAGEAVTVSVIEAYAAERLLSAGALDVTLQPILMKKGRPGQLLRVIARQEDREALAQMVFAETSTLGLRIYAAERRVQSRSWEEVDTPHGKVRVKVSGEGAYAPEYEDCRRLAAESGVALKQIIAEANFAYLNKSK
jgi:uncharacterized protein (TIGR00299 family) protein